MKRFVIKPAPGKTTVSLLTHQYLNRAEAAAQGRERGTQVVYLGSFSAHLNPHALDGVERIGVGDDSTGVRVKSGVLVDGVPFELTAEDIQEIRAWLMEHGTWAQRERRLAEYREHEAQRLEGQRTQLAIELRAELEASLRADIRAELERETTAARGHPIDEAVRAVQLAGVAVAEEAARLKAAGHRLSTRRAKTRTADSAPVTRLLDLTRALRTEAFSRFEDACKAAGLMGGRKAGASRTRGTKPRKA